MSTASGAPTLLRGARHVVGSTGLNRSMVLRRLVRLGHPQLRRLRVQAMEARGLRGHALAGLVRWVEDGELRIPQGHAVGLRLDMHHLPISHAHLGSFAFGTLETSVQEALIRHLAPGAVFFDIGANLGFFSLLGSRLTGPGGRVVAFEAAPDNARAVIRNAELNEMGNIEVVAKAVSSHPGKGHLQIVDDQSWSKLAELGPHPGTEEVLEVELVSIDGLLANGSVPPPDVVKIDVEGAELAVIEGMRATITAHRPAIICELHDTAGAFVARMAEHSYRLINLEGTEPVSEAGGSAHCLALPPLHPGA